MFTFLHYIASDIYCAGSRSSIRSAGSCLVFLLSLTYARPGIAQEQWCATYTCPNCAAHGAGPNTQSACFPTKAACENLIRQNFSGLYYGSVTACTSNGVAGNATNPDGSINGLVKQSSEAIGKGIAYGNGQMVGMGMAGLGVALLLSGGDDDPQAAARAEQARQAEMQRQLEESERVRAEIMQRQELARQRIMHDLKDSTDPGGNLQLKTQDDAPLVVASVSNGFGTQSLVPVTRGGPVMLAGLQMKGLDDTDKVASNSGFDTSGKLMGSDAVIPNISTPTSAPVMTREQKIQQALQQDPAYSALTKKKDEQQQAVDDAQKKLDELNQQKQSETDPDKQQVLDHQISDQSKQLETVKQDTANTDQQMKIIETKIAGSAEIVD